MYGKGTDGRVTGTRRRTKGVRMRTSVIMTVHAAVRAVIYMRPIGPVLGRMDNHRSARSKDGRCVAVWCARTGGIRLIVSGKSNEDRSG